ncbi:hypothetical protein JCM14469_20750 [Desulfatiferula olefinivorans]
MDTNDAVFSGWTEMMGAIGAFQKDAVDRMVKTMTDSLGEQHPMAMFVYPEGMSDLAEAARNTTRGMLEIAGMLMPGLDADGGPFTENISEIPARIMKKLLEIPPVGITRPYQEKINRALDKLTGFHTAAQEFVACTCVPLEEATRMTLKEIVKQAEAVKSPQDIQKIYERWLHILEDEYQALFKTDRYKTVLARTISAMSEFRAAGRELMLDLIHLSGLPCGREVEELSRNVYELKKKIKAMDAQIKKMQQQEK